MEVGKRDVKTGEGNFKQKVLDFVTALYQ